MPDGLAFVQCSKAARRSTFREHAAMPDTSFLVASGLVVAAVVVFTIPDLDDRVAVALTTAGMVMGIGLAILG